MTLSEIKQKTLELLNSNDETVVEHITQEILDKDNSSKYEDDDQGGDNKSILTVYEGHNSRLQYIDNEYWWVYERGEAATGQGCGNAVSRRLQSSRWSGTSIGRCTGNDHKVRFTRI
jgi:hypothetical protein